ncbi:phosphoribosylformylglycinamidine synthase subunit PurQ, partial [Mycobacterium sp. ITM-2017-0098]
VLGICNGFQVLCEAGLLPGALTRNAGLHFICRDTWLEVASNTGAWTSRYEQGADLLVPLKSGEGRYVASEDVLDELEGEGRVVFR